MLNRVVAVCVYQYDCLEKTRCTSYEQTLLQCAGRRPTSPVPRARTIYAPNTPPSDDSPSYSFRVIQWSLNLRHPIPE